VDVLRTPDDRFAGLPGFPFAPHYVDVDDGEGEGGTLRVHYVDEGPADGPVVLLMHGEPTWSFLYRHMIPVLVDAGLRCVAPDLVGFGRSDKPAAPSDYTYARHVEWMRQALLDDRGLGLAEVTLVCQDWGSLIGLRLVGEHPERFARVVVANGGLPTGEQRLSDAFLAWQKFSQESPQFPIGNIVDGGSTTDLGPDVVAGYDAPFPSDEYTAGARILPALVPTSPDDPAAAANKAAWEVLARFERPLLTAFSDGDPITRGGEGIIQRTVPGARGRDHVTIAGGGHFLQEDRGPELAAVVADFVRTT
jgi:haloalkane dehalogenase